MKPALLRIVPALQPGLCPFRPLLLALLLAGPLWAQTPNPEPVATRPSSPLITFSFDFPGAVPGRYSVAVESNGQALYRSEDTPKPDARPDEPYNLEFTVSEPTRTRLFELAKQANYFQGDFEFNKGKIANMGAKTLAFSDEHGSHQTQYNYSMNPAILQITKLFQDMSSTLEFNRRLVFLYRFDKLGIDAELKNMENADKQGDLAELQVAQPILSQIAADHGVMNVARRRADILLHKIASAPTSSPSAPPTR